MLLRTCGLSAIFFILAGCATLAPEYTRPAPPVPTTWPSGPAYEGVSGQPAATAVADTAWQDFFLDPQLRQVIALALEHNRDLRVALLNIERSQAQYQIRRADLFPKVDANAAGSAQRVPDDLSNGRSGTLRQYNVGLGVSSYELDLFGRVRSLKEQALQQYLATEEARRSIQITLVANVAADYLTLAADSERLQLARETLANQEAAYRLIKSRFEAGVASALDLDQAQTSVDTARVDIARFTTLVAQDENALDLLAGAQIGADAAPRDSFANRHPPQEFRPRPAIGGAAAPSRHPAGRIPAEGGQRQHRRGAGGLLSPDYPAVHCRHRQ